MKSKLLVLLSLLLSSQAIADTYIYRGSSIINLDTQKEIGLAGEVFTDNTYYNSLIDDVEKQYIRVMPTATDLRDIRGNLVFFAEQNWNAVTIDRLDATDQTVGIYRYGRNYVYNVETNKLEQVQLIAYDEDSYNKAKSMNYNVIRADAGSMLVGGEQKLVTFASNVTNSDQTSNVGNFYTNQVSSSDGTSVIRQEDDGTIHLGQNSLVFGEAGRGGFVNDTLYSSNGVLEIGNNKAHRTVINGTLEIQDPTAPNHAATKNYVDSNFHTKNYVDSSVAQAMAMSALPRSLNGKTVVGFGAGTHGGQQAVAFGVSKYLPERGIHFNASVSHTTTTSTSGSVGMGFEF